MANRALGVMSFVGLMAVSYVTSLPAPAVKSSQLRGNSTLQRTAERLRVLLGDLQGTLDKISASGSPRGRGGGATFTRWGKRSCPAGSEKMYDGFAAGSYYNYDGGAGDLLCLTREPSYGHHISGYKGSYLYGTEYYNHENFPNYYRYHDMVCAVCRSRFRSSAVMVPGRNTCVSGWHLEYHGYLMAGYYNQKGASKYSCVDHKPQSVVGSKKNEAGHLLYHVVGQCGSLPCPPYKQGWEITCAVCTK